jgi:HPt (histidine-containing phosphotransfer) domain-containing protein
MLNLQDTATVASPSLVPDEAIDQAHLFRMTLGDHSLEAEVLRLFDRQSVMLMDRMSAATGECRKALAHTLKGSARGIGAWRVAQAAESLERIATNCGETEPAVAALQVAVDEARGAISELLRTA